MKSRKPDRWAILKAVKSASIPKTVKIKPKASAPRGELERDIQAHAEQLCMALGIRFFRIPDKLMGFLANFAPAWVRVFVARYLAGTPDLMLFRPLPDGTNEVKFVEIKRDGGKVSQGQTKWHAGLNVHITYGWEETKHVIEAFHLKKLANGG